MFPFISREFTSFPAPRSVNQPSLWALGINSPTGTATERWLCKGHGDPFICLCLRLSTLASIHQLEFKGTISDCSVAYEPSNRDPLTEHSDISGRGAYRIGLDRRFYTVSSASPPECFPRVDGCLRHQVHLACFVSRVSIYVPQR